MIKICDNTNVGDLSNLTMNSTTISLFSNDITGTLPRLSQFVNTFDARNNSIQGSLSSLLCQEMEGNLTILDLSDNLLSGGLTDCWKNLLKLVRSIDFSNNNLSGTIPDDLFKL